MSILFMTFWFLLVATCLAAYRWGAGPERWGAALYLGAALSTIALHTALPARYSGVEVAVCSVDLILLICLALLASRSNRWWPSCALALQALTVLAHVGKMTNPHLWRLGYQLMATWTALPSLGVLGLGIWLNRRRKQRSVGISN